MKIISWTKERMNNYACALKIAILKRYLSNPLNN